MHPALQQLGQALGLRYDTTTKQWLVPTALLPLGTQADADALVALATPASTFTTIKPLADGRYALLGSGGSNAVPVATNVAIAGVAQAGKTLTGSYSYADNEGNPEGTSLYQWYRADDASGTNRTAISGATAATYLLTTSEVGKFMQYAVTPVASAGTATGTQVVSAYSAAIAAADATALTSLSQDPGDQGQGVTRSGSSISTTNGPTGAMFLLQAVVGSTCTVRATLTPQETALILAPGAGTTGLNIGYATNYTASGAQLTIYKGEYNNAGGTYSGPIIVEHRTLMVNGVWNIQTWLSTDNGANFTIRREGAAGSDPLRLKLYFNAASGTISTIQYSGLTAV